MTPNSDSEILVSMPCECCDKQMLVEELTECSCGLKLCAQCVAPKELGDHGQVYHKKTAVEDQPQSGAPVCPHCGQDITHLNMAQDRIPDAEKVAVFMLFYCLNPKCRKVLPCAFMGYEPLPPKYDDKPDSRLVKLARGGGVLTNDALARSISRATRNRIPNVRKVQ